MYIGGRILKLQLRHSLTIWVLLGLGFVLPATKLIDDPDIWWHLKTGEMILASHSVPTSDPFSFTCHGQPWVAHEWLSEVIFAGIFSNFGLIGLILAKSLLICGIFAGIFVLVRKKLCNNYFAALGITALCGLSIAPFWSPRPQLFTYLLVVGLLALLDRPIKSRLLWLAVPMFMLWSNLHGAWFFGYAVMTVILGEAAVIAVKDGRKMDALKAVGILAASLLAVLVGPLPIQRLTYPLQYFGGDIPAGYVIEFQSPNFWNPLYRFYEILLLALPVVMYLGRQRMKISQWVLMLVMINFSLYSARHVPLFGIIIAPIFALQIQGALGRYSARNAVDSIQTSMKEFGLVNLLLILVLPLLLWAKMPRVNNEANCITVADYPIAACNYLSSHPRIGDGKLLNNYNWGGYLIYRLYPKYLVSLDGRADIHRKHMVADYKALENLSPDWQKQLSKNNPDVILWPVKKPLAVILRQSPNWRVAYEDAMSVIFVKKGIPTEVSTK